MLRTLEKKGFINRRRAEDDRRKILVTPTEAGRSYIAEKTDVLINILSAVVGRIGEKEALQLVASLDLWNTAYTDVALSEANTDE
ncbi:MAG: MarR family transcriptional regulator [Oscillospiraceae bacterium]|nr:MarR family transcriptional regulator [Oscillospiraceae bacterium]